MRKGLIVTIVAIGLLAIALDNTLSMLEWEQAYLDERNEKIQNEVEQIYSYSDKYVKIKHQKTKSRWNFLKEPSEKYWDTVLVTINGTEYIARFEKTKLLAFELQD